MTAPGTEGGGSRPSAEEALPFLGGHVLVSHRSTQGEYCLLEASAPPGDETPAHVHRHDEETFYLLQGTLKLRIGDDVILLEPGMAAVAPRGVPHAWVVVSDVAARWLNVSNGGLEDFARAAGTAEGRSIAQVALEHGIDLQG